jgi:hypothetical protein
VNIKASTCEAYIVEEISTFISYYFKPHLRTRINHIPRRDDSGEVPSSMIFLIFSNLGWDLQKDIVRRRYLTEIEFGHGYNYVLLNINELRHFIK